MSDFSTVGSNKLRTTLPSNTNMDATATCSLKATGVEAISGRQVRLLSVPATCNTITDKTSRIRPAIMRTSLSSERDDEFCARFKKARVATRTGQDISPSSTGSQMKDDEIVSLPLAPAYIYPSTLAQAFLNIRNNIPDLMSVLPNNPMEGANNDRQHINANSLQTDSGTNKARSGIPTNYREIAGAPVLPARTYQFEGNILALEPRRSASNTNSEMHFDPPDSESDEDNDGDGAGEIFPSLTQSSIEPPLSKLTLKVSFSHPAYF